MGETTTYRSSFARVLAVVTIALCGVVLVSLALTADLETTSRYAAPVLLLALLAWVGYWRPRVEISDGGIEIRNVWRTVEVPWPALQEVDSRLGLRLVTAYGTYQAWAVPGPRRTRGTREVRTPEAAALVVARWEALRDAGYLDEPRLERPRARTRLHVVELAAAALLLALSVVALATG